jgi:putative FmdB family regulatory protein
MPIYEYERGDGTRFEVQQSFSDEPLEIDHETGQKVRRVFSSPTIRYNGTGFFSTSYRSRPKDKQASGD